MSYNKELAKMIDHTILKADATEANVINICEEALDFEFASVCVNTYYVPLVANKLKGSNVKTCCVVGFPLGAMSSKAKAAETALAIEDGAQEIDMVINVGLLKSGKVDEVQKDIEAVVNATQGKASVKVIIETCLLTDEEKKIACELAKAAKADFVKTSTGFSTGGATVEDIALMRKAVGSEMGVKASGGIRDFEKAMQMKAAGASRIGASASISIVTESLNYE